MKHYTLSHVLNIPKKSKLSITFAEKLFSFHIASIIIGKLKWVTYSQHFISSSFVYQLPQTHSYSILIWMTFGGQSHTIHVLNRLILKSAFMFGMI